MMYCGRGSDVLMMNIKSKSRSLDLLSIFELLTLIAV